MWAYWHSLSVGSGKPVSWRMKIRLTSLGIYAYKIPLAEGTMRVYTSRWNVLRSALLTFSIKVPDFTDGQRKTIPQKCWCHLTGRGNKCKFNEKFWKNERMSRIFLIFAKITQIFKTWLVHFGASWEKRGKNEEWRMKNEEFTYFGDGD